ncbi:hypothetical protein BDZ88DRAFT_404102 [Geranomyces variabilis]|nr:hypothetical protein BDZ88DRAFT_404102 [Geranomyces variabilis]KAJ3143608.1 hypothetical protein HDU90_000371 [Geranomyces variabilis]
MHVKLISLLAFAALATAAPTQSATGIPQASCRRGVSMRMPAIVASGSSVTPGSCAVACKSSPYYAISQTNATATLTQGSACRCADDDNNGEPIAAAACEVTKCADGVSSCGDAADVHVLAYYENLPAYIRCVDSGSGTLPAIITPRSIVTPLSCAATCSTSPYFVISQSSVLNPRGDREAVCRCARMADPVSPVLANKACAASKCVDGSYCGDSKSDLVAAIYRNFAGPVKCVKSSPFDVPATVISDPAVTPLNCANTCKDFPYFAIGVSDDHTGFACRCARDTNIAPAGNQFDCTANTCVDGSACGSPEDRNVLAYYDTTRLAKL